MLDLTGISVVDNHCHPVLLEQQMERLRYRAYFTEASDPTFVVKDIRSGQVLPSDVSTCPPI